MATVLAVVFCGLGQIHNGETGKGLCLCSLYLVALAGGTFLGRKGWAMALRTEGAYIPAGAGEVLVIASIFLFSAALIWAFGVYDAYTNHRGSQYS